ncbi:MAG: PRC-barrel domain containing protein [Synergistaceae bacterium]|nr:PRC-barrel domain containing protein [Synergistaceae bacterium]
MVRTHFLRIVSIMAILLLAFSGAAIAAQPKAGDQGAAIKTQYGTDLTYRTQGHTGKAFKMKELVGSNVRNLQGEELGKIEDIVVDVDSGQILYAIMDFGGFLGIGTNSFPVPWDSLAPLASEGVFYLNVTKDRLKDAPSWDKDKMPEMAAAEWGDVGEFYFPRVADREDGMYRRDPYGSGYGYRNDYNSYGYSPAYGPGYGYGGPRMGMMNRPDMFQEHFKTDKVQEITGEVMRVDDVMPEFGTPASQDMAYPADDYSNMQTRLLVYTKDKKQAVQVYLGPRWYVGGRGGQDLIRTGDTVTVKGAWVESDMGNYMIASSLTEGSNTYQLRDDTGRPVWSNWNNQNTPATMQDTKKK